MDTAATRTRPRRSEKETHTVSPSKFTKRELQEHYFSLVENNVELKKTVNAQTEKLRMLSTRLLRVNSGQKRHLCKTPTKCCTNAHTVIEVLKATVDDLQQVNVKLNSRVRMLSMRLSTHRQFSKISPGRASSKFRVSSAVDITRQITDRTVNSDGDTKIVTTARSLRDCESNDSDAETVISKGIQLIEKNSEQDEEPSHVNELLKNEILNLQEELKVARDAASTQEEKTHTTSKELAALREEMQQAVRAAAQRNLQEHRQQLQLLTVQMREAQGAASTLIAELAIEKKKVIELNTRLKAAGMATHVVSMLEERLMHMSKSENDVTTSFSFAPSQEFNAPKEVSIETETMRTDTEVAANAQHVVSNNLTAILPGLREILPVYSNEELGAVEIIKQLMNKVSSLQWELDVLKVSKKTPNSNTSEMSSRSEETLKPEMLTSKFNVIGHEIENAKDDSEAYESVFVNIEDDGIHKIDVLNNTDYDKSTDIVVDENDNLNININNRTCSTTDTSTHANTIDDKNTVNTDNELSLPSVKAYNVITDTLYPPIASMDARKEKSKSSGNLRKSKQSNRKRLEGLPMRHIQSETVLPVRSDTNEVVDKKNKPKKSDNFRQNSRSNNSPTGRQQLSTETITLCSRGPSPLRNKSSSSSNKTYIKEPDIPIAKPQSLSSGNTERDIPSMTSMSERERDNLSELDQELSRTDVTSSEYTSFSESVDTTVNMFSDGEIPTSRERKRKPGSAARRTSPSKLDSTSEATKMSSRSTSAKVEETLRAINLELNKCQALLHSQQTSERSVHKIQSSHE